MVANGLSFVIYRTGQRQDLRDDITRQVAQADKFKVPYGLYHWFEPGIDATSQINNMFGVVQQFKPRCLFLDFEQAEGHYGMQDFMSPSAIDAAYHKIYDLVRAKTTLPVMIYSGYWFISRYAPNMTTWIGPWWEAEYRRFNPANWVYFGNQLHNLVMPSYAGYPAIAAWQFAGTLPTAMVDHGLDYNLIDDDAVYNHLFGGAPVPPPVVVPPPSGIVKYVVANPPNGTYLQSQPSWNSAAVVYLDPGSPLDVDPIASVTGWLRCVKPLGWVDARRAAKVA
jgi:hypothetical protein